MRPLVSRASEEASWNFSCHSGQANLTTTIAAAPSASRTAAILAWTFKELFESCGVERRRLGQHFAQALAQLRRVVGRAVERAPRLVERMLAVDAEADGMQHDRRELEDVVHHAARVLSGARLAVGDH